MFRPDPQTKQDGHIMLLTIAVLVVVAASGFFVWQHVHTDSTKNVKTQQEKTTPANPSEGGKYLTIKEWGVKFKIPQHLYGDISYFENDRAEKASGGPILTDLLSKEFSAGSLKCAVIEGDIPRSLVSINRELDSETGDNPDSPAFKYIDGARFYLVTTPCEEAINREGSDQDKQLLSSLKEAVTATLQSE